MYKKYLQIISSSGTNISHIFFLFSILVITSFLEILGLLLVIPYIDLMMDSNEIYDLLDRFTLLKFLEYPFQNYRINLTSWFILYFIIKNIALTSILFFQSQIIQNIHAKIALRLYEKFLTSPYEKLLNYKSSELIRYSTYDLNMVSEGLKYAAFLLSELLLLFGVVILFILLSPISILIVVIMLIPIAIIFYFIKGKIISWGKLLQKYENIIIKDLQETVGGIIEILLSSSNYFKENYKTNLTKKAELRRNREFILESPRYLIELIMISSGATILLTISYGSNIAENLSIIAFIGAVIVRLLPMTNRILLSINQLRSISPSVEIIFNNTFDNELKKIDQTKNLEKNKLQIDKFISLDLKNVTYSYTNNKFPTVKNVNFSLKFGELIGITGKSGSGKSTLVNLILGFLTPDNGTIKINEQNIQLFKSEWMKKVGYVQQNVFLRDVSIEENIAYGLNKNEIDKELINKVIKITSLNSWIDDLPDGINTIVGERGLNISGGQRQRIAIARSLYSNPSILILDEATSSLDNYTQNKIMNDLQKIKKYVPIIVVAHRLETIKNCKKIFVLHEGKIDSEGSYEFLINNSLVFQNIINTEDNQNVK